MQGNLFDDVRLRGSSTPLRPKFTPSQLAAIQHEHGPCRVLAGPGSGKTTVLTHRYVRLVSEAGARPERTLVITFTTKASEEMTERISTLLGRRVSRDWIGTMHSRFLRILRAEYGEVIPMSETDGRILIGTAQKETGLLFTREIDIEDLLRTLDKWRLNMVTPNQAMAEMEESVRRRFPDVHRHGIRPAAYVAPVDYDRIVALAMWQLSHLYGELQRRKRNKRWVDFTDMIYETWVLLSGNDRVRYKWENAFDFVLVDEFQDIDPCQWEVVRILSSGSRNLFVVGDESQAVYSFRFASPKIFINFDKTYEDSTTIVLEENFRSPVNIVDISNVGIAFNKERIPKVTRGLKDPVTPIVMRPATTDEEGDDVIGEIRRLVQIGIEPKECVVVYRTHSQSLPFEVRLMKAQIPYVMKRGSCFYDIREAKDLVHYLEIACGRFDLSAVENIANRPTRFLGKAAMSKWRQQTRGDIDGLLRVRGATSQQARALSNLYESITSIQDACQRVDGATGEIMSKGTTVDMLDTIDRILGYRAWAQDQKTGGGTPDDDLAATFRQIWRAAKEEPDVFKFLHSVRKTREWAKKRRTNKNAVTLSTFHGVKGLEYDHVFLTGMVEGTMPHKRAESEAAIEEERRLAYVGLTRTKHSVMLTSPTSEGEPSRFLSEWGLAWTEKKN